MLDTEDQQSYSHIERRQAGAPPHAEDGDGRKEALLRCQARQRQAQVAAIRQDEEAQVPAWRP